MCCNKPRKYFLLLSITKELPVALENLMFCTYLCWCIEMKLIFVIIFYAANFLISSNSCLWIFYGQDHVPSSFPVFFLFILSSSNDLGKKPSSTMLNRSGESRYPFIVTDLTGKTFSLSPLTMGYL